VNKLDQGMNGRSFIKYNRVLVPVTFSTLISSVVKLPVRTGVNEHTPFAEGSSCEGKKKQFISLTEFYIAAGLSICEWSCFY
jgi:hypothetical protein